MDNWKIWDEFEEITLMGLVLEGILAVVGLVSLVVFIMAVSVI